MTAAETTLAMTRPAYASLHTDAWTWVATIEDGSSIAEIDADGYDVHGLAEVPLARVVAFTLLPCRAGLAPVVLRLDPAKGQRLIFTHRRQRAVNPLTNETLGERTVHLLGYSQEVGGETVRHVTYWDESGAALVCDDASLSP